MDIFEKVTIKLTHEQVVKLLEEYLLAKGYTAKKVTADVTSVTRGSYQCEYQEPVFTGFTIEVQKKEDKQS